MNMNTVFNPTRLTLARKRRGYKKTELAQRIGTDLRTVVGYEAGEYPPSSEVMRRIEAVLWFPMAFFYGDDIEEPAASAVSFRALTKMAARHRDMARSQGAIALHFTRWLESKFELPPNALPDLSREPNPETAAESVRECWGIGQLPVRNMIHLLEAKGVRVFSLAVDTKEVDAFSHWKDGTPFVFLNGYKSSEHSRFDAAHELGHLVLHKHGAPQGRRAEHEADRFASAFLMPRGSVLAHAPRFPTIAELIRLKKIWTTSVSAVAYRLHELKLLSDWQYRGLCIQISKRGFRTNEPEEAPRESSLVLPAMLQSLYRDEGLTRSRIASELAIPPGELEQLLFALVMTGIEGGRRGAAKDAARLSRVK